MEAVLFIIGCWIASWDSAYYWYMPTPQVWPPTYVQILLNIPRVAQSPILRTTSVSTAHTLVLPFFISCGVHYFIPISQEHGVPQKQGWCFILLPEPVSYTHNKQHIGRSIHLCGTCEWTMNGPNMWSNHEHGIGIQWNLSFSPTTGSSE